jgi:hypothetical protein
VSISTRKKKERLNARETKIKGGREIERERER